MNRRAFLAVAAGAAAAMPGAGADASSLAGADAARLERRIRCAYPDPDIVALDPRFNRVRRGQHADPAPAHRHALGRRAGVERRRPVPGVERHPEQRAAALARRGRPGQRRSAIRPATATATPSTTRAASCPASTAAGASCATSRTAPSPSWPNATRASRSTRPTTSSCIRDGGIWFTDPDLRHHGNYEGFKADSELPVAVYRVDAGAARSTRSPTSSAARTASASRPTTRSCTSPTPARPRDIQVFDVRRHDAANGRTFREARRFPGRRAPSAADGIRCDVDGNIWAGARPGVQVIAPDGEPIGHDPPARDLRQRLLRRREAQPAVHDRQPVALRGVREHAGAHIA